MDVIPAVGTKVIIKYGPDGTSPAPTRDPMQRDRVGIVVSTKGHSPGSTAFYLQGRNKTIRVRFFATSDLSLKDEEVNIYVTRLAKYDERTTGRLPLELATVFQGLVPDLCRQETGVEACDE